MNVGRKTLIQPKHYVFTIAKQQKEHHDPYSYPILNIGLSSPMVIDKILQVCPGFSFLICITVQSSNDSGVKMSHQIEIIGKLVWLQEWQPLAFDYIRQSPQSFNIRISTVNSNIMKWLCFKILISMFSFKTWVLKFLPRLALLVGVRMNHSNHTNL